MNILLTGATGFIGSHLIKALEKDHNVFLLSRSQNTKGKRVYFYQGQVAPLIDFLTDNRIHGVIHLASLFLAEHKKSDIENLISSNILLGTQLLEACVSAKVEWFINTGTFWQHYNNEPYNPVNLYAATKQAFEDIAKYYVETSDLRFATLKLNDTFGEGDTRAKVFNLWIKIAATGEALDMSEGKQLIDISYIDDVCEAYLKLIDLVTSKEGESIAGRSYAVKANTRISLRDLAVLFEKNISKRLNINWGKRDYRPREVMVPWEHGETVPNWKQRVSLESGIKKVIKAMTDEN